MSVTDRRRRQLRQDLRRRPERQPRHAHRRGERPGGDNTASSSYQVVRDDDPTIDPPTGDVLRTYRLALITDPGYAAYIGGPANVTAAKVTLINRVSQVYEDDLSIKLQLIANNDLLNLNTWAQAIGAERPVRRRGLLHAVAASPAARARRAQPDRHRPDHRRRQLRHRPPRARPAGRRRREPRRRRPRGQGAGLHRHPDADRRLLRDRLRGPRDGPPVQRQPPVQRHAAELLRRQPQRRHVGRARLGLVDHGVRRHLPHRRPPGPLRPVLLASAASRRSRPTRRRTRRRSTRCRKVALRHFGGGNEVQVATFGPGFAPTATIQPLTVAIGAVPSATQLGGAQEVGNTVTISTGAAGAVHTLQPGDVVTISGVANAGYNGTFTVTTVPTTRTFTYTNPISGLPTSGGGTITLAVPGLRESGNTVTVSTVGGARPRGRRRRDDRGRRHRRLQRHAGRSPPCRRRGSSRSRTRPRDSPNSGGGTMTFISPFNLRIAGNDSTTRR